MRPGSDQVQIIAFDLIDENPVWLDMAIAMVAPLARKRVVFIPGWQRLALDQQQDGLPQVRAA